MLEKGIQIAIPFFRPHPRSKPQTVAENLHRNWNIERGHFIEAGWKFADQGQKKRESGTENKRLGDSTMRQDSILTR
jgi:hypothetical protein